MYVIGHKCSADVHVHCDWQCSFCQWVVGRRRIRRGAPISTYAVFTHEKVIIIGGGYVSAGI